MDLQVQKHGLANAKQALASSKHGLASTEHGVANTGAWTCKSARLLARQMHPSHLHSSRLLAPWVERGVSHCRALQEACPKADAFYTIGRREILHCAGALPLHKAPFYVDRHAGRTGGQSLQGSAGGLSAGRRLLHYRPA